MVRVLQDSPDVDQNLKKIKIDKADLCNLIETLVNELTDTSYAQYRQDVKFGIEKQGEYEKLLAEEKEYNMDIKKI